ncbi:hypothetical protein KP509_23G026900 [Ceratopteris richardii]|uniref:Core Histone H2A/H2B/H3 domain-containing protein n=1 Tax=Ceratopteris richardii TaxID=49495 RepID=A0A8T2S0J0_CERRI|nr:hypothetical protein KP509_23G026900 [Ceratopteris richardii]
MARTKMPRGKMSKSKIPRRVKYHVKSLREIRRAQKSVGLLIPRLPFMRVVKQISANLCSLMKTSSFVNVRWQTQALLCLQEAAEDFAIDFMNDAYLCATHSHRVTLMAKDYVIVSRIRYKFDKALLEHPKQQLSLKRSTLKSLMIMKLEL